MESPEVIERRKRLTAIDIADRSAAIAAMWARFIDLIEQEQSYDEERRDLLRRTKAEHARTNYLRVSIRAGIPAGWTWASAYEADVLGVAADVGLRPAEPLREPVGTRGRVAELCWRYTDGQELFPEPGTDTPGQRDGIISVGRPSRRWEPREV